MLYADGPLEKPAFLSVKELLVNSLVQSNVRSAIVNCICPECGGAIEIDFNAFTCAGRCGKDWRPIWENKHYKGDIQTHRNSHLQIRKSQR